MKKLSQLIQESEDNKTKAMVNNDKKQFYFVVTAEKPEKGWRFVSYSAPSEKVSSVLKNQGYKELNENLSLKRLIKEAERWPYFILKNGYLYDEEIPEIPAFNVKFKDKFEAEKWLEDNDERGNIKEDAQDYSDADSGSGIIMNPNQSELNDSTIPSTEFTFTAPDGSKIKIEVDPKDYHIMGISSDKGQATETRFELKAGDAHGQSAFKKDSIHKEFDPLSDEDKWRNH